MSLILLRIFLLYFQDIHQYKEQYTNWLNIKSLVQPDSGLKVLLLQAKCAFYKQFGPTSSVYTVQQFLGPLVGTWWSLDGTTGHTRLENRIEPHLKN